MFDTLKTTARIVSVLAVLHLLAMLGGLGFLYGTGRLDKERARYVVDILSGADMPKTAKQDQGQDKVPMDDNRATESDPAVSRVREEIAWREAERYRTELEQQLKLVNAARMDLTRDREAFERQMQQEKSRRDELADEESKAGRAKELALIQQLSSKYALRQIMSMTDADAARLMFELDTRKAKKIFEAAKTQEELQKTVNIRRLLSDIQSTEIAARNAPGAS